MKWEQKLKKNICFRSTLVMKNSKNVLRYEFATEESFLTKWKVKNYKTCKSQRSSRVNTEHSQRRTSYTLNTLKSNQIPLLKSERKEEREEKGHIEWLQLIENMEWKKWKNMTTLRCFEKKISFHFRLKSSTFNNSTISVCTKCKFSEENGKKMKEDSNHVCGMVYTPDIHKTLLLAFGHLLISEN